MSLSKKIHSLSKVGERETMVVPVRAPANQAERIWFHAISDFTREFIARAADDITGPIQVKPKTIGD